MHGKTGGKNKKKWEDPYLVYKTVFRACAWTSPIHVGNRFVLVMLVPTVL